MGNLADRFGEFDDRSVIYRADDSEQKIGWRRLAVSKLVGAVAAAGVLAGLEVVLPATATFAVAFALVILFLVAYVVWRRRRNQRLTGSPTSWPSPSS